MAGAKPVIPPFSNRRKPKRGSWVRLTNVSGTRYVQVVQTVKTKPTVKLEILASFGKETVESVLRATFYSDQYNLLIRLIASLGPDALNVRETRESIFTVFGWILGRRAIASLLGGE